MICSQPILVVAVVDSHFDRDRGIYQTDQSGWNSNVVGVSSICCASKALTHNQFIDTGQIGETWLEYSPSYVSHKTAPNN